MLAAMQRSDLTPEARRKMLQKMAPQISTLEKKYKVIFNSDARRDPLDTQPSDFTVDVTPDLLPTKVNGFEMIGYSFPQSEWAIEPYENALPMRFGWSAYPGCRGFGMHLKTYSNEIIRGSSTSSTSSSALWPTVQSDPSTSPFPFEYTGTPIVMYSEQPLVRNPVVSIQVVEADAFGPKRVVLTFARRVGTSLPALLRNQRNLSVLGAGGNLQTGNYNTARPNPVRGSPPLPEIELLVLDNVGLQSAVGTYPGRYALRVDSIQDPLQQEYFDLPIEAFPSTLPEEPILNTLAEGQVGQGAAAIAASSSLPQDLYTLTVTDPEFTQYFVSGSLAESGGSSPLGMLYCRPPTTARELALRLSIQFTDLISKRKRLEGERLAAEGRCETCPLSQLEMRFESPSAMTIRGLRFCMGVQWSFEGELVQQAIRFAQRWNMDEGTLQRLMNPVIASCADGFGTRMGLPVEVSQMVFTDTPFHATVCSGLPPRMDQVETVDLTPLPEGAAVESYFSALNTTAGSMRFEAPEPVPPIDPDEFLIPILLDGNTTPVFVNVRAGEYRPWSFAAALTVAARSIPALRSLELSVTPVYLPETGNSFAGFRFASMAPTPQTFGLPFSLASDTTLGPNLLPPSTLGFRSISYTGLSVYDPQLLSLNDEPYTAYSAPVTFPVAELGLGVPSPLPTIPLFLEAFGKKRIQVMNQNPSPVAIRLNSVENLEAAASSSSSLGGSVLPGVTQIPLELNRAALFHHMQPLRVDVSIEADKLILGALAGEEERSLPTRKVIHGISVSSTSRSS